MCNFVLDDQEPQLYTHVPENTTEIYYNQVVFHGENLANSSHVLRILPTVNETIHYTYLNFDYAVYT
jgi:hypothetical protein